MPITIVIAEDQRLFRQSLRLLLEHERDLVVVYGIGRMLP